MPDREVGKKKPITIIDGFAILAIVSFFGFITWVNCGSNSPKGPPTVRNFEDYQYSMIYVHDTNEYQSKIKEGWNVRVSYSFRLDAFVMDTGHYWLHCDDAIGEIMKFCLDSGYEY